MKTNWITLLLLGGLLLACSSPQSPSEEGTLTEARSGISASFANQVIHAQHFSITLHEGFKAVIVKNPWKAGDTLASYALYPRGTAIPDVRWAEFKVAIPIEAVVATSSPHIGFLALLDELGKVTGVADDRYIFNPYIYEKVTQGAISKVGSVPDTNLEVLLDLSPDLVMKTGMDNVRNDDQRLTAAGIPIAYDLEWMETTLLARAEWMKFFGVFFDKDREADSIFQHVEKEYNNSLSITKSVSARPSIMTGNNFNGTWYMPSANNYLTKLMHDAGGYYHYRDQESAGSLPLSFEVVLDDMIAADYWIGPRAQSLKELEMMDERYALFKAFQEGNVYTFDGRTNNNGGNDYWESGMARPDLILKDIIKIIHPELLPDHQLYYYKRLQ